MAHSVDVAPEEDLVTRMVQEIMLKDAVEAVDVGEESPKNGFSSRETERIIFLSQTCLKDRWTWVSEIGPLRTGTQYATHRSREGAERQEN